MLIACLGTTYLSVRVAQAAASVQDAQSSSLDSMTSTFVASGGVVPDEAPDSVAVDALWSRTSPQRPEWLNVEDR